MLLKKLYETVKHCGGGIMRGCMSAAGVRNLYYIEENMDKFMYLDILKQKVSKSIEKLHWH